MHCAPSFVYHENLSLDKPPGLKKGQRLALTFASHSLFAFRKRTTMGTEFLVGPVATDKG